MRPFQEQHHYHARNTVELSTHFNGNRRDVLAGLKKKAMSFRNQKSTSKKAVMVEVVDRAGNDATDQGTGNEVSYKITSPSSGGSLKKVIRRGRTKKSSELDERDKENWMSPMAKRNNKEGMSIVSFYKKADQAKQSKQKEHSESRRTLLLSTHSRSKRNALSMRTIQSTPDTVATGMTSSAYSMRSIMTPTSSDRPKSTMGQSVVSLESSTMMNNKDISTRASCSVATTVVGSHHDSMDGPKTPSSASTSSFFPLNLEHRHLHEHSYTADDEITVQTSPQHSYGKNVVIPTTRRLSPIMGTPSPSHSCPMQPKSKQKKGRASLEQSYTHPTNDASSPFSTTVPDPYEDTTPVKELFAVCTPSTGHNTRPHSDVKQRSGDMNFVSDQEMRESGFQFQQKDAVEENELLCTFDDDDDDDDQSMDGNYDEDIDENLADLLQSMGPFSNTTIQRSTASMQCSSGKHVCCDLPETLIRQGMFSRAISLLQDPRFIEQRIAAQQGHWASTTRLHIRDLKYLNKAVRRKHEQNQKQIAAEASLIGAESTTDCRAAFLAQRRAVSMRCIGQQTTHNLTQQNDDKFDLVDNIPNLTLLSLKQLLSVVLTSEKVCASNDCDVAVQGAFPTKVGRKDRESKEQLTLMEVLQMCTKYLRRCDWNREALLLYNFFIGAQQKQLDYSNTHVAVGAAKIFVQVGRLHATLEEYTEAVSSYQVALGLLETTDNRVDYCATLVQMGHLHCRFGALEESLKCYQDVYDLQRMVFGESSLEIGFLLNNMGVIQRHLGRLEDALQTYTQCHAVLQLQLTSDHIHVAHASNNIAGVLRRMGRYDEAMDVYRHALELKQRHLPPCHPSISLTHAAMGATLRLQQGGTVTEEAMKHYRAAMK